MKIKKKWILSLIALILFILIGWTLWANTALEVNEYEIVNDRIPQGFDGFRIAQISDLHNAEFGERNEKLIQLLSQTDPDIIVITGDLIDSRHTDIEIALDFARQAIKLAPVYYVSGNHEARVREYEDLKMGLAEAGVVILENQKARITREGENAIELTLKCMLLSRTDVNVEECVQRRKRKSHILYKDLWISVKPMIEHYAKEMGYDLNIVQLADTYLFDLSKLDKEGDKFRYPTDYGLVYSLQLTQVDYYQAVYWLIGIFNFVLGCSDMLDVAYEYECDMRSEYL